MDTHDETLGWKQRAIKEHILHQEALQKISELSITLDESQQLLKKTTEYNRYFENKFYILEKKYAAQENKLLNTIAILKKAQQLIQQRKNEIELQNKKHTNNNDTLLAKIDLLTAKNSQLTQSNTQLKQEIQHAQQVSATEKLQHEQTTKALHSALENLEKAKAITNLQQVELARYSKEDLDEFFVYKVLNNNNHEDTNISKKSRQK